MSNNSIESDYCDLITVEEYSNNLAQATAGRAIRVRDNIIFRK